MTFNRDRAIQEILEMNRIKLERVDAQDEKALEKGQADDSPLLKALETNNVQRVARRISAWYDTATRNGHYKKGGHRYLVHLIDRLVEMIPGDEKGTVLGGLVQMPQPQLTYHLLGGIAYKVLLATAFNRDGDQQWAPLALADRVQTRVEVAILDRFLNRVNRSGGQLMTRALNEPKRGYTNRQQSWSKQRDAALAEALESLRGREFVTAADLESLRKPLDYLFPPDKVDEKGRQYYDTKQALLFLVVECLCYHYEEGTDGYDKQESCHFPFLMTRDDPTNKYSAKVVRINPDIKAAKDAVRARLDLDQDAMQDLDSVDDLMAEFCLVFRAMPFEPQPWRYTGLPDRLNGTGGFTDDTLRTLCPLHRKRESESDTISSPERIEFINRIQGTEFEINKPVLDYAVYLRGNDVSIDGLACRHPIRKYQVKRANALDAVLAPVIAEKRDALMRWEQEAIRLGIVTPAPGDDPDENRDRERSLRTFRNTEHKAEWRLIRKRLEALNTEIQARADQAVTTGLALDELSRLSKLDKFHYVVQVDGRLRIYFVASNSSPTSGNLNRWCHQFHRGQELSENGWRELKLALGTAVLGNKPSINERIQHGEMNLERYREYGRDLVGYDRELRALGVDEFWWFCALCSGLAEYERTGVWKVAVARDAAASGLGWWSVLTGDEIGARLCNLVDTNADSPASDAYLVMLEMVREWVYQRSKSACIKRIEGGKLTQRKYKPEEWLQLERLLEDLGVLRKAAKGILLTGSYGSGHRTRMDGVKEQLPELSDFEQAFLCTTLTRAMNQVFSGCAEHMKLLKQTYTELLDSKSCEQVLELQGELRDLNSAISEAIKKRNELVDELEPSEDDGIFDLADGIESKLVSPLKVRLKAVQRELAELRYRDELEHGPITWKQVDGSVIHQCKLLWVKSNLSLPGHGELKFGESCANTRDGQKARQGVPPDFIHSCDSQQLAMAFRKAEYPVYTIHDCCYVLPNDMDQALTSLKRAMVDIVRDNPLKQLYLDWGFDSVEFPEIVGMEQRMVSSSLYWN